MARAPQKMLTGKLGTVSIGAETAKIGFSFERGNVPIETYDALLTGARLEVHVRPKDDNPSLFPDNKMPEVKGVVDVKAMGVKKERISIGLTFSREDGAILESLAALSTKEGKVTFKRVGDAGEVADDDDDDQTEIDAE